MTFHLGTLESAIKLEADTEAFWLRPTGPWDLGNPGTWPQSVLVTAKGQQIAIQVDSLLERGLAQAVLGHIRMPWIGLDEWVKCGLELPLHWMGWSPYLLKIDSTSSVGREDFEYAYQFLLGSQEVLLHREGGVVQRAGHPGFHLLDPQTYALLEAMDAFNRLPPGDRQGPEAWVRFAEVKGCAHSVGAQLDEYLASNDVVVPSKIGLTVVEKSDGSLRFLPRCEGLPKEAFERAFQRSQENQALFHLDGEDGKRVRVVLGAQQQDILGRMRRVSDLKGSPAEQMRRRPDLAFEGLLDNMEVAYARRVEGIGDWKPLPLPKGPSGSSFLELEGLDLGEAWDDETEAEALGGEHFKVPTTVHATDQRTGEPTRLRLEHQPDARAFLSAMKAADQNGQTAFSFRGHTFPVDWSVEEALRQGPQDDGINKGRKFLLIYTDEDDVQAEDRLEAQAATAPDTVIPIPYEPPRALNPNFPLKPHQEEAVAWLQRCAKLAPQRRGVLLADEMGLGKTLEILTFAAWAMEKGIFNGLSQGEGPYRPILIVAPLMLVENETWQGDMAKFFQPETFGPVLVLRGQELQSLRIARGRETELGKPLLDLDMIRRHRVVITNYETVTNFQHSLAQIREGRSIWSMVVTDEAQEFKNPQSRISHALKALHPDFHIASTGTPVENRLLDIWNLFDAIQPSLLGSAREFKERFEAPVEQGSATEALDSLRETLHYQKPHAFLLRREKTILPGFPKKHELVIPCPMSPTEVDRHMRLIRALNRADSRRGLHLSYLHRLVELYQHPLAHRDDFETMAVRDLVNSSPKLQGVLDRLQVIRDKGEKVLIFARHIKIQRMLARVIGETFGLHVSIINGETGRTSSGTGGEPPQGRHHRATILQRFKDQPGFHALVLSPFVAGVGLTITEANHVIHYGRWWNPAVEAQATDRVYRIGQEREVQVHLPILQDAQGRLGQTFDERLQALLDRKRSLARDFLTPVDDEQTLAAELYRDLAEDLIGEGDMAPEYLDSTGLAQLPKELFEAYTALVFEQNGWSIKLTDPRHSAGLTLHGNKGRQSLMVQVSDRTREDELDEALAFLKNLHLGSGAMVKVLVARRAPVAWITRNSESGHLSVWGLHDLAEQQAQPLEELDVLARNETREKITAA